MLLISFSYYIVLANISSDIFNGNEQSVHPCLFLDVIGNVLSFYSFTFY